MTLKDAMKIAERTFQSKVSGAGDCGRYWGFGSEADKDKMDGWILLVDKESGDTEFVLPSFFVQSLESGEITCTPINLEEGNYDS